MSNTKNEKAVNPLGIVNYSEFGNMTMRSEHTDTGGKQRKTTLPRSSHS